MNCESCGHENLEGARFCANCGANLPSQVVEDNPLVGKVVGGRYRITRVIGEGGMGVVYEAEQRMGSTLRKVAVKTLHAELSRDPSVTARFHRECGTVAQLEHPNTIKVYDFGTMDDGTLYIAMEYLAGKPLERVIAEEGPLAPERVLRLLRQIAGSLTEAHKQGIIHRDLKPENVILIERAGEKDVVKLLDFGIAARTESADAAREAKLTQQGMVLGTPPYMSPEQFTGKALDKRSDIYSLAVVAYEMLTCHLPFDATTPWQWATEHMTAQPRPFETLSLSRPVPEPMREAILKALAKEPSQRFDSVAEFVEAMAAPAGPGKNVHSAAAVMATAAMEAPPDFGAKAAPAPTAAMPVQGVAVPAAPAGLARAQPSGPNKGLLIGLSAAAVALVGAIGLVLSNSSGGEDEPVGLVIPSATTEVKPVQIDETPPEDPDVEAVPSADEETEQSRPSPQPQPKPSPAPKPAAAPKVTPSPAPNPAPSPKPSPPAGGPDACDDCTRLARAGSPVSAIPKYNACSDTSKKGRCLEDIKKSGVRAVTVLARKDCAQATQVAAAVRAAGAGSPQLEQALAPCK